MPNCVRSSTLQDGDGHLLAFSGEFIELRVVNDLMKFKIQCRPDVLVDLNAFDQIVGTKMPTGPQATTDSNRSAFWLAPNEWLVVSKDMEKQIARNELSNDVPDQFQVISDVSDSMEVIELTGAGSRELLREGCCLDFHASSFQVGQYATTRLLQTAVIIHYIDESPCFRIFVDGSVTLHLWRWLVDGARQFK